ncbi:hypothetical protein [Sphingomonas sp. Root710]|uniref:hypothetical protein n=1 Tax=Sphingomonas sp. Root710 TaxID=1736594 RepID=UPI000A5C80A5|nr:hypothetical protein [Sphingomonas sp. Root710]
MPATVIAIARSRTAAAPSHDGRWHPARRALTMVALGALAWVPVIIAGRLIVS